jgi:N-acetylglucosamine-6-phosphate deacetylase
VTHTFNAMRPLDHRDPGILGEALTDSDLTADVIADGIHVAPKIIELFVKAKGLDRCVLITDAIAATGMPDGRYGLGTLEVEVSCGRCVSNGKLAGSVLTLDRAVRNIAEFAHLKLSDAVRFATINPARVAKLHGRGRLEPGARADFVILSPNGEVRGTVIGGMLSESAGQM